MKKGSPSAHSLRSKSKWQLQCMHIISPVWDSSIGTTLVLGKKQINASKAFGKQSAGRTSRNKRRTVRQGTKHRTSSPARTHARAISLSAESSAVMSLCSASLSIRRMSISLRRWCLQDMPHKSRLHKSAREALKSRAQPTRRRGREHITRSAISFQSPLSLEWEFSRMVPFMEAIQKTGFTADCI